MKRKMECFSSKSTEERIREAAKRVFLEKGFDGATSRDIAEAAGINIALTNYYFRSKEKLFINIFEEMCELFFKGMIDIMNKSITLREKIAEIIAHDFRLMKENPSLSLFIMTEIHRNPDRMVNVLGGMKQIHHSMFEQQIQEAVKRGDIRPISAIHLMPMMVANVQFVFIGKAMHMKMWHMSEADFDAFVDKHQELVVEMITSFLFEFEKA